MGLFFERLQAIKNGTAKPEPPKEKRGIAKVSEKQKQKNKEAKPNREEQLQWFKDCVAVMKGRCLECGCKINKNDFQFAIMAIAHVLPKRDSQFPSVKTHKENWIELCAENGCHHKYDTSWEDAATMKVWPLVIEKFKLIYPSIAPKERKNIPDVLLQELEPDMIQ